MAKVTIQDVAREAGVALGTVSNALNHPQKVRPSTLETVRAAMDKLGYAPNQSARMLAGGKNNTFGLVLPRLDHGISLQIANGAHNEARKNGYDLLIANADNDDILEDRYLRYFLGTQVAGVLVQPMAGRDWRPQVSTGPVPTVYLDIHSDEPGYFVAADNEAQGALVAEHAVSCGAHRVAVFGQTEFMQLVYRAAGVGSAAQDHPDVAFEFIDEGSWNLARDGYEIGRRLAERPADERPDAVIALTDVLATGAIAGIEAAGLSVPDDIAVIGGDGNPLAWTGSVPLTTVAPPGYEMGRRGVQYLIEQIEVEKLAEMTGEPVDRSKNHQAMVRPFLLARASSGAVRGHGGEPDLDLGAYL